MKASPPPVAQLESRPALQRLRERMQGVVNRLEGWAKRVARRGPSMRPASSEAGRAVTMDARTSATNLSERSSGAERGERPASATVPARRITAARSAQAVPRSRSYLTESMSEGQPTQDTGAGANPAEEPPAQPAHTAASLAEGAAPGAGGDGGGAPDGAGEPRGELTSEQAEEARRALARNLLKGTRNGMLLTLEPGYAWEQVMEALSARLAESPTFFQRSVLSIDTRRRALLSAEMEELRALLAPYEMTFKEVGSDELNDPRVLPSGAKRPLPAGHSSSGLALRPGKDVQDALITRRTVRSGQRLQYESSVVIMGDVNSGGEVIAGGDVIVWGALRGTVHAGYPGNEEAVVGALVLAPVQLRIGHRASRPPEDDLPPPQTPEIASVKDGQIVVESWNAGRTYRR